MRLARILALLAASAPGFLCAADAEPAAREGLPLKVANRTIIELHGPIAGHSAKDRVAGSRERIDAALAENPLPVVSTEDTPGGTRVLLGGKTAFLVTRADIDEQVGETTALVAGEAVNRLRRAIVEHREQSSPRYAAMAAAQALAASLAFAALAWLLLRLNRWAAQRISSVAIAQSKKLNVGGVQVVGANHILTVTRPLLGFVLWLLALLLGWAWLGFVLGRFPYTRPWGEDLEGNLAGILGRGAQAVADAAPGLLLVVVVFFVARAIIRAAGVFFERVERGKAKIGGLDADTAGPTRRIFSIVVWVFALAMAYPYLPGAQSEAFKGLSVLVGLMVSLGAASVLGQGFSGLILMYTRAIRAGEYVRVGAVEGTVVELSVFVTRIRTGMGAEISMPNSTMMSTAITNYSRVQEGTGYVVDTVVTIGYATPWRQVHAMLHEAARRTAGLAPERDTYVRQTALSDYYVEYRLVAYTPAEKSRARAEVLSDLHANIQDVFNEHGVQIMSPHYMADPREPQVVPRDKWHLPPAPPPEKKGPQ